MLEKDLHYSVEATPVKTSAIEIGADDFLLTTPKHSNSKSLNHPAE
jgi:hypothetical protein